MKKPQKAEVNLSEVVSLTGKELGLVLSEPADFEAFVLELTRAIQYLIDKDFEKLMHLLYRVDVNEQKVKQAFSLEKEVARELALLVIEREKQKVITRAKYK